MFKKGLAKTATKRFSVFVAAFVICGVLLGSGLITNRHEEDAVVGGTMGGQRDGAMYPKALSLEELWEEELTLLDASVGFKDGPISFEDLLGNVDERIPYGPGGGNTPTAKDYDRFTAMWDSGLDSFGSEREEGYVYCPLIPISDELQRYTYEKCGDYDLSYELVLAVMWRESRFNVNAVHINSNGTQDSGIMQINDVNRSWLSQELGISDLMDPYQNIEAGVTILGRLYNKYGEHKALIAYQYGEYGMQVRLNQGYTSSSHVQSLYQQRDYFTKLLDHYRL